MNLFLMDTGIEGFLSSIERQGKFNVIFVANGSKFLALTHSWLTELRAKSTKRNSGSLKISLFAQNSFPEGIAKLQLAEKLYNLSRKCAEAL
jgi:hypothetical protein